jgi:hypothetical protein
VAVLHVNQIPLTIVPFFDFAHVFPLTCQLGQNLPFGCVREFARVAKAFTPFAPTLTSFEIVRML